MYKRSIYKIILARLQERRQFLQILAGPRQTGKTTLANQAIDGLRGLAHYASADAPTLHSRAWIEEQWSAGRLLAMGAKKTGRVVLVLDEIQKIPGWSEIVKQLWDEDTTSGIPLRVLLLGSSPLLLQKGITESLAGRFEMIRVPHWSFSEMRDAFGWDLDRFLYFGGYPGAVDLISDATRWSRYILDSLIETTLSRDVLLMTRVDKPALLRRLFHLSCDYSGQILSYQKMLGQLQDAGNTTTLAHYLELLSGAGMVTGVPKFAGQRFRQRASSPKLQVLNTALMTAESHHSFESAREDRGFWGRLVESAIGAHLINSATGTRVELYYWRERGKEVDFVLRSDKTVTAIEVRSGRQKGSLSGMGAFAEAFHPKQTLLVGAGGGIPLEEFLLKPAQHWAGA